MCNRPGIIFTFANVILTGMVASWPPCHIENSTSDAIWERVNLHIGTSALSSSALGEYMRKYALHLQYNLYYILGTCKYKLVKKITDVNNLCRCLTRVSCRKGWGRASHNTTITLSSFPSNI